MNGSCFVSHILQVNIRPREFSKSHFDVRWETIGLQPSSISHTDLAGGKKSGAGLPRRQTLRLDDPRRLGLLATAPPPPTSELVQSHVVRGEGVPQSES